MISFYQMIRPSAINHSDDPDCRRIQRDPNDFNITKHVGLKSKDISDYKKDINNDIKNNQKMIMETYLTNITQNY